MDRGPRWTTVRGVANSQARLSTDGTWPERAFSKIPAIPLGQEDGVTTGPAGSVWPVPPLQEWSQKSGNMTYLIFHTKQFPLEL